MRSRLIMAMAVAAIVAGGFMLVPAAWAKFGAGSPDIGGLGGDRLNGRQPAPEPTTPPPPPPPALRATDVSLSVKGFSSWALLDRKSGQVTGSANVKATSSTESMVKVWIVSDYLRREAAAKRKPSVTRLKQATAAIIDSDDDSTQTLYQLGGGNRIINRLIKVCELRDTFIGDSGWWSRTQISARDAVQMGQCVADGRAAGPTWTKWVLTQMRKVRGTTKDYSPALRYGGGRWGIIDGLPKEIVSQGVAIKNGWTQVLDDPITKGVARDNSWHVNCLAVHTDWVLAVLLRYPRSYPLDYGAKACADVASQLVYQPTN